MKAKPVEQLSELEIFEMLARIEKRNPARKADIDRLIRLVRVLLERLEVE